MARTSRPTGFIDFEIVGTQHGVQKMLNHIDSALSPIGLAAFLYGGVQPWLVNRAKERFASEGDDVTGKWAPLQQSTVEIRQSQGFEGPHPINRRTGELERYITESGVDVVAAPGVGTLRFPGRNTTSKSVKQKLSTAQKGRINPSTVPRPVLGLNEKDLAVVMTQLALHIQGWTR